MSTIKIKGQLNFSVMVRCPSCQMDFDVVEQDDDSSMAIMLFNNKWEDLQCEYICPYCKQMVLLIDIEY